MELFSVLNEIIRRKHLAQCLAQSECKKKKMFFHIQRNLTKCMDFLLGPAFFSYECLLSFFMGLELDSRLMCAPHTTKQSFISCDSASQGSFPSFNALHYDLSRWVHGCYHHRSCCLLFTYGYCLGSCIISSLPSLFIFRNSPEVIIYEWKSKESHSQELMKSPQA